MTNLPALRRLVERATGERARVEKNLSVAQRSLETLEKRSRRLEKAQAIIQEVAKLTQQELEFHVSDLVSHALAAVFRNPYTFSLQFNVRRNKTEADLLWQRGDSCFQPNGGGVRDVSSFALRVAFWTLQDKHSAPVLILDEPFKGLKPTTLQERAGQLMKEVAETLGVQILMVSHDSALAEAADTSYNITMKGGVSNVQRAGSITRNEEGTDASISRPHRRSAKEE